MNEEEMQETMDYLETTGALYPHGMDEQGEVIYRFDMETLNKVMPSLYNSIMEDLDKDLLELYKKGLVDIQYDENLEASFRVSKAGERYLETGILPESDLYNE